MTDNMKYPRTAHLPWSPGKTSDDVTVSDLSFLQSDHTDLVTTEKMDGGNLTMTRERIFGRSVGATLGPWDSRAKILWSAIRYDIPEGWRVSGESLATKRSIRYESLPGPYLVFGIWDETDTLISWDETTEWATLLGLPTVPVLYRGTSFEEAVTAWQQSRNPDTSEGFVVRHAGLIDQNDFADQVVKYVRQNHVVTTDDWRHRNDHELNGIQQSS